MRLFHCDYFHDVINIIYLANKIRVKSKILYSIKPLHNRSSRQNDKNI